MMALVFTVVVGLVMGGAVAWLAFPRKLSGSLSGSPRRLTQEERAAAAQQIITLTQVRSR